MQNNIKAFYSLFILIFLCLPLGAELMQDGIFSFHAQPAPEETEHLPPLRSFNEQTLEELRNDSSMDYYIARPNDSLWDMFRKWLFYKLTQLFGNQEASDTIEVIFYAIAITVLIYAILRLLKIDLSGLIGRKPRRAILETEEGESHENIHEIDFATALAEALQANEFNKAIRLLYLSALKELTKQEHIRWQPGKTNYQYQQELQAAHLQSPFRQLGFFFEYAWYGNFTISEQHFREAERTYKSLQQNLKHQA